MDSMWNLPAMVRPSRASFSRRSADTITPSLQRQSCDGHLATPLFSAEFGAPQPECSDRDLHRKDHRSLELLALAGSKRRHVSRDRRRIVAAHDSLPRLGVAGEKVEGRDIANELVGLGAEVE